MLLLNELDLDSDDVKCYGPILKLSVLLQLLDYLTELQPLPDLQVAIRANLSLEIAVLK